MSRLRRVITEWISAPPLPMTQEQALRDQLSARWVDALYRCILSEESISEVDVQLDLASRERRELFSLRLSWPPILIDQINHVRVLRQ